MKTSRVPFRGPRPVSGPPSPFRGPDPLARPGLDSRAGSGRGPAGAGRERPDYSSCPVFTRFIPFSPLLSVPFSPAPFSPPERPGGPIRLVPLRVSLTSRRTIPVLLDPTPLTRPRRTITLHRHPSGDGRSGCGLGETIAVARVPTPGSDPKDGLAERLRRNITALPRPGTGRAGPGEGRPANRGAGRSYE